MKAKFPIASLALLITCFACLLVSTDVDRWREQYAWLSENWPWRMLALFGGAAVFGGFIGVGFMFTSRTRWRARLLAPVAGIIAAEVGVLILVAPGPIWRTIVGVVVLICTATVFRMGRNDKGRARLLPSRVHARIWLGRSLALPGF